MPSSPVQRVLFVSYAFPPTGGVGVHRVSKFVKYLPEFGWECSVLTVANPSAPLRDESMCRDIPASTIIRRARTWEPGYAIKQAVSASGDAKKSNPIRRAVKSCLRRVSNFVLQPDPQILWRPAALKAGLQLLNDAAHQVIVATGPPFSSLMLGATLSRRSGVPLILDYRDEWGISNAYWENKGQGRLANLLQQRMQRNAIRAADVLLATTPSSAAALRELAANCGHQARATHIYNGFDPDDFVTDETSPEASPPDNGGRYRLTCVGTLWNLNPIGPLVTAIERLARSSPQLLSTLELVVAGRRTAEQEAALDRLKGLPCQLTRHPFVSHSEACRLMRTADGLLLLNADLPETHRIINAKTFEYMAAQRPMFVLAPRGDLTDIVENLPGTVLCDPGNPEQIADRLAIVLEQHRCGIRPGDAVWDISRFERKSLAAEMAELLNETCGCRNESAQRELTRSHP